MERYNLYIDRNLNFIKRKISTAAFLPLTMWRMTYTKDLKLSIYNKRSELAILTVLYVRYVYNRKNS